MLPPHCGGGFLWNSQLQLWQGRLLPRHGRLSVCVVTPIFNPIIYSLRNKVKGSLRKLTRKHGFSGEIIFFSENIVSCGRRWTFHAVLQCFLHLVPLHSCFAPSREDKRSIPHTDLMYPANELVFQSAFNTGPQRPYPLAITYVSWKNFSSGKLLIYFMSLWICIFCAFKVNVNI